MTTEDEKALGLIASRLAAGVQEGVKEGQVLDAAIVHHPELGIVLRLRHPSLPKGGQLRIFIAARGHEFNPLDRRQQPLPGPAGEYDYTYAIFVEEGLRTGMFRDRWIEVWPNDFYVTLYDETRQAP